MYKKYIIKPFKLFLNTLENKKLGLILLIDLIFYIIFYIGFRVFAYYAKKIFETLKELNLGALQNLNNLDIEAANQLLAQLQNFIASIIGALFLFILFIIVILTVIKGYEWSKIVNKKLELFGYVKLLILNIIWFFIWVIIFIIPFFFIRKETYLRHIHYLFPPIIYFTLFLYMDYAKTKSIWNAVKAPITEGILKLHKYVSGVVIIVLFFAIPFLILKLMNLQNKTIHLTVLFIIVLVSLAVYKLYFYSIEQKISS